MVSYKPSFFFTGHIYCAFLFSSLPHLVCLSGWCPGVLAAPFDGEGHLFYEVEVIRGLYCLSIPLEEIIFNKCSVISLLQVGSTIGGFAVGQTSLLCTKSYATKES